MKAGKQYIYHCYDSHIYYECIVIQIKDLYYVKEGYCYNLLEYSKRFKNCTMLFDWID